MAAYFPISHTVPQYVDGNGDPYSGAVLKAYSSGTSTKISMATDSTGGTTATSIALNASGYPEVSGNIVIPYVNEKYKLALYPTQAAADSDTGAIWNPDAIPITTDLFGTVQSISSTTSLDSSDADNHIEASGTITINLPAVANGIRVSIRNAGSGTVTIDPNGSETINGASTLDLAPGESIVVIPASAAYFAIGKTPGTLINNFTAITTLQTTDQLAVADNSDSNNNKKITIANFLITLAATTSQAGVVEKATAAEVTSETADKYPDASLLVNHPGIAKGWANFAGASGTIADSYNVTSVSRSTTGTYVITWDTDFASANYSCVAMAFQSGTSQSAPSITAQAAGSITIETRNNSSALYDPTSVSIAAFGAQ